MAITLVRGRQDAMWAEVSFTFANLTEATLETAVVLPGGSTVVGGELVVTTAWDSATSATGTIGDAASNTRYGNAINMKTLGRTALTLTGFKNLVRTLVGVKVTNVGTPTVGAATLRVQYTVEGRAVELVT